MAVNDFFNEATVSNTEITITNLSLPVVAALPDANSFDTNEPVFYRNSSSQDSTGVYIAVGAAGSKTWLFLGGNSNIPANISRKAFVVPLSNQTNSLSATTSAFAFVMPAAFTVTEVQASLTSAATGSTVIVDINSNGTSILGTKLSIDAGEKTSSTAASQATITASAIAKWAEISYDIDQVGSGAPGTGLVVNMVGQYTAGS